MTKEQLQKELNEKITEGVKPSDIKKLKRSKSADDIAASPPTPLLQEQLKTKQQEIESLRKKLEVKNTKLKETNQELDNSLFARYEAVKQFGLIYDKLQLVRKELDATVDEASNELVSVDDKNSQLRTKLFTAQQQIASLQKDLNLSQRLAEMRKYPLPSKSNENNWEGYLKFAFYSAGAVLFILWITNNLSKEK